MTELAQVPVTVLKGVGAALAEKLAKVGLENLQDILFHLPTRYQDRTRITPIGELRPGQDAVVEGIVAGTDVVMGRRRSLLVRLQDGSGTLSLRFFHFSQAQKDGLKRGTALRCYGEVRPGATGLEIYHPEYRAQSGDEPAPVEQSLTPIYPTTEGLTQQRLRQLSQQALARLGPRSLPDWLPDELARDYRLAPLDEAIRYLHRPPPDANVEELAEVLDGEPGGDPHRAVRQLLHRRPLEGVVLVGDLAHDLLEDVLDGDQSGEAAVLVDHDGDVDPLGLEVAEHLADRLGLGHERRRPHELLDLRAAAVGDARRDRGGNRRAACRSRRCDRTGAHEAGTADRENRNCDVKNPGQTRSQKTGGGAVGRPSSRPTPMPITLYYGRMMITVTGSAKAIWGMMRPHRLPVRPSERIMKYSGSTATVSGNIRPVTNTR